MADALDVLSLADGKRQLRLLDSDSDVLVEECIRSAVSFIGAAADTPLVDVESTYQAESASPDGPVCIPLSYINSVSAVSYWEPSADYRDPPVGSVDVATLGRLVRWRYRAWVYPPADGWPARRSGSPLLFTVVRRRVVTPDDPLWQACVLTLREFHNGYREVSQAGYRLILTASAEPDGPMS